MHRSVLKTTLAIVLIFCAASVPWAAPLEVKEKLPAPQGFSPEGGCVAAMGTHYVRKAEWPLGPILGYDEQGNLVFIEYMIKQDDFRNGKSWKDLPGLARQSIDHVDIDFMPEGHPGLDVPHYDVHMYLISHEAESRICPGGFKPKYGNPATRYSAPR